MGHSCDWRKFAELQFIEEIDGEVYLNQLTDNYVATGSLYEQETRRINYERKNRKFNYMIKYTAKYAAKYAAKTAYYAKLHAIRVRVEDTFGRRNSRERRRNSRQRRRSRSRSRSRSVTRSAAPSIKSRSVGCRPFEESLYEIRHSRKFQFS